jgi:hypothetical protein
MMKFLRRLILLAGIVTMTVCVMILRGMITFDAPDSLVLAVAVGAGVVTLVALARELQKAVYHPEPEDPPVSDKMVMPHEPEEEFIVPHAPAPPPVKPKPTITPEEMIERVTKAVEAAEGYTHKANGRVKISLEMDEEDDHQDD